MRNATLLSLALSSLPARCCDVSFLSTYLFPSCFTSIFVISFVIIGTCLDFAAEDCRSAIVLLQDRAQHIGESVDGCQRALTTMHSVMLPRNPLPATFPLLLNTFRSSQRIHRLIELNLVAGANFALRWIRKWHPRLNYSSMSLSLAPGGASLRVHMENTLQPARRLVARLLEADAAFFREYHYLDPLGVDDSDNPLF
jgi:hypothetical protein